MAYWRLYYHIVWATKQREPRLVDAIEQQIYPVLVKKSHDLNVQVYAVNGMPDHVHVVAAIPPTLSIPDYVQNLKGVSSRFVHVEFKSPFAWQEGYGIFTISEHNLKRAMDYVRRQKEHHEAGTIYPRYERFTEKNEGPQFAFGSPYGHDPS